VPDLYVQQIKVTWTKSSRGAAGATKRNQVPHGFAWPLATARFHGVEAREEEAFAPRSQFHEAVPEAVSKLLLLQEREGRLTFRPAEDGFGMPRRHRRPPHASLVAGDWLRWSMNYRFGLDDGWRYELLTWNVAYGIDPSGGLFTQAPPRKVEELAALR
jgi:hypothetical protein